MSQEVVRTHCMSVKEIKRDDPPFQYFFLGYDKHNFQVS